MARCYNCVYEVRRISLKCTHVYGARARVYWPEGIADLPAEKHRVISSGGGRRAAATNWRTL